MASNLFGIGSLPFLVAALALTGCETLDFPRETVIAAAPAPQVGPGRASQTGGTYRLKPGDAVSVFIFDNPDISQGAVVGPDGRLSYPLAGSIQAEGKTLNEVGAILTSRFSETIVAPQVTVSLSEIKPYRIFVSGEVVQPGAFELQDPITLVQAVSLAGGFTAFADRSRVLLYNPRSKGGARRVFDYDRFLADPLGEDAFLQPGDTIIVH